jgi:hypothetical protein
VRATSTCPNSRGGEARGDEVVQRLGDLVAVDFPASLLWQRLSRLSRGHRDTGKSGLLKTDGEPAFLAPEADGSQIHSGDQSSSSDDDLAVEVFEADDLKDGGADRDGW